MHAISYSDMVALYSRPNYDLRIERARSKMVNILPDDIETLAARLMACYTERALLIPLSTTHSDFDIGTAYRVLDEISTLRRAAGWKPVGRKIGFTNRTIWARYGVSRPIWAPMWSRSVRFAQDDRETVELATFVQPRIEPEVVFKLSMPLSATADVEEVLQSVEWLAPGFEIVQCHFSGWRFSAPDCIADFGLHGALVVGTPVPVATADSGHWASALESFDVRLIRESQTIDRGNGALVLGSPLRALAYLAGELAKSGQPVLAAGEIVTTGTLTDAWPVAAGEKWSSDYSTLGTRPLTIHFV